MAETETPSTPSATITSTDKEKAPITAASVTAAIIATTNLLTKDTEVRTIVGIAAPFAGAFLFWLGQKFFVDFSNDLIKDFVKDFRDNSRKRKYNRTVDKIIKRLRVQNMSVGTTPQQINTNLIRIEELEKSKDDLALKQFEITV